MVMKEEFTDKRESIKVNARHENKIFNLYLLKFLLKQINFKSIINTFLKYFFISFIFLTILYTFVVGKINLTNLILRSAFLSFLLFLIRLIYERTNRIIPWKLFIISILILFLAYIYTGENSFLITFDYITGISNLTNSTILPFVTYFRTLNYSEVYENTTMKIGGIINASMNKIDDKWVSKFIKEVNYARAERGLSILRENDNLNSIAYTRFKTMIKVPEISHYGGNQYNIGEVVFYPEGSTPEQYVNDIKINAPLHWNLLVDPMFSFYGYYFEEGPVLRVIGPCPVTEIPGPNINVTQFFEKYGCKTQWSTSTWLVIVMK